MKRRGRRIRSFTKQPSARAPIQRAPESEMDRFIHALHVLLRTVGPPADAPEARAIFREELAREGGFTVARVNELAAELKADMTPEFLARLKAEAKRRGIT